MEKKLGRYAKCNFNKSVSIYFKFIENANSFLNVTNPFQVFGKSILGVWRGEGEYSAHQYMKQNFLMIRYSK